MPAGDSLVERGCLNAQVAQNNYLLSTIQCSEKLEIAQYLIEGGCCGSVLREVSAQSTSKYRQEVEVFLEEGRHDTKGHHDDSNGTDDHSSSLLRVGVWVLLDVHHGRDNVSDCGRAPK